MCVSVILCVLCFLVAEKFYFVLQNFFQNPIDEDDYVIKQNEFGKRLTSEEVKSIKEYRHMGKSWLQHAVDFSIEKKQCIDFFKEMLVEKFPKDVKDNEEEDNLLLYITKKFLDAAKNTETGEIEKDRQERKKSKLQNQPILLVNVYRGFLMELLSNIYKDIGVNYKDNQKMTALLYLLENSDEKQTIDVTNKLLKRDDLKLDEHFPEGSTLLHYAVKFCKVNGIIKELVKLSSQWLNAIDADNKTPLHIAFEQDNHKAVQILLDTSNIDCNIQDFNGKTSFYLFCSIKKNQQKKLLEQFLEFQFDVNVADQTGKTAFHHLCKNASAELIKLFVEARREQIEFNKVDNTKKTALFYCRNNTEAFNYLIKKKVFDVTVQDDRGKTILHYYSALSSSKEEIAREILNSSDEKLLFVKDKDENLPKCWSFRLF